MRYFLAVFTWLLLFEAMAQDNLQCQKILNSTTISSNQIIVVASIKVLGIAKDEYKIIPKSTTTFRIEMDRSALDTLEVCFLTLPPVFSKLYQTDSTRYYDSTALFVEKKRKFATPSYLSKRQQLFNLGKLNRSGQISRGFSTGNTQGVSTNSSLNLNLQGKLSNNLNIKATITDQNIPFQPEGNTQQLQDFDKVFLQLYNDQFSVTGGDIVLENGDTRFLKYRKNVLGGKLQYFAKNLTTSVEISSAKGQFASEKIKIQEGVYGPYKIPSPNNQSFVLVIANSEKIYLDGKKLIRGYNKDYVIDYNQAEIKFTSNVLITAYTRIKIDYEYAVRNYSRSIITASHTQKIGNFKLGLNYYLEKDNKNKSLFRELSEKDKQKLNNVGDNLEQAIMPSEKLSEKNADKILYLKKEIIIENRTKSIFIHTQKNIDNLYTVQFAKVRVGTGNYQIKEYLAQGRVYEYVGEGKGSYIPFVLLAAPNKKQMISITGKAAIGKKGNVYFESSFSQLDKNLFSKLGAKDNNGQAFAIGANIIKKKLGSLPYTFSSNFETTYLSKNFAAIDRFRKVEFDRDWGITTNKNKEDIHIKANINIEKNALNFLNYSASYRFKKHTVQGFQHQINGAKSVGFLQINASTFLMDATLPTSIAKWRKLHTEAYIKGKVQLGYRYILEQNTTTDSKNGTIISSKNYFKEHQFFVRGNISKTTNFEVSYAKRLDKAPKNGELKKATDAETVMARLKTQLFANHFINIVLNYRKLTNNLQTSATIESVSGRIDWVGNIIPKYLKSELSYHISNARVPKREYVFMEVATGEGTHTWRDKNGDGIKNLNEFYEAFNYDEKRFIKIYVPSNKFVSAFENRFNYKLFLKFPKKWGKEKGFKKLACKFSNITSWTTQYSTTENNPKARLFPFLSKIDTSKLLSARERFRSTFFINKNNPVFGINFSYLLKNRKILYTNGFEGRKKTEYSVSIRWNIKQAFQIEFQGFVANKLNKSNYLKGRNYEINDKKMGPSIAWQPKPSLRITTKFKYGFSKQHNTEENQKYSLLKEISSELRIGTASKFVFNASLKYTNINFVGKEQSPVGYELLQGLRPGNNYSVVLSWQQKLVNGLKIQVFYNGRKPENTKIIHSVRAGISALF